MNYRLTLKSANRKTGPIPVSTTSSDSCPPSCPFKVNGCYAQTWPLRSRWLEVDAGKFSSNLEDFCAKISALPKGTLWRHNQAGDLPGEGAEIDSMALGQLVKANKGKFGFTYTHKPMTKRNAMAVSLSNYNGFTINLSANDLAHADQLLATNAGPVVTVLPSSVHGNVALKTPAGNRVVVCPATYRDDVTCKSCQLCSRANRKVIVGFPAHGAAKKAADSIAKGSLG